MKTKKTKALLHHSHKTEITALALLSSDTSTEKNIVAEFVGKCYSEKIIQI